MNNTIAALLQGFQANPASNAGISQAAHIAPITLRKQYPGAAIWHVTSAEATENVPELKTLRGKAPAEVITKLSDYVIGRLAQAAGNGIDALFIEEPSMTAEVYFGDVKARLLEEGLKAELGRVSRHRHCDHANGKGKGCLYNGEFDGGVGDISNLYLKVSLPVPAAAA